MNCILSMWMLEQTGEGERVSGTLNSCMSEHAEEVSARVALEYLDFRTGGSGCAHELHLEYMDVRADLQAGA